MGCVRFARYCGKIGIAAIFCFFGPVNCLNHFRVDIAVSQLQITKSGDGNECMRKVCVEKP